MAIRSAGNPYGGVPIMIDKTLGEAYPNVLKVAEHLKQIVYVSNNVEQVYEDVIQVAQDKSIVGGMLVDTQTALGEVIQAKEATEDARDIVLGVATGLDSKVDKTTTVNGKALSGNITITKGDVGLGNVTNTVTMIDNEGFIKESVPLFRLLNNGINKEGGADGTFTRVSTGVYVVNNVTGLRPGDSWYVESPSDYNGNKYYNIEWEQEDTPVVKITVRVFERVWNPLTGIFDNGNPMDIPAV